MQQALPRVKSWARGFRAGSELLPGPQEESGEEQRRSRESVHITARHAVAFVAVASVLLLVLAALASRGRVSISAWHSSPMAHTEPRAYNILLRALGPAQPSARCEAFEDAAASLKAPRQASSTCQALRRSGSGPRIAEVQP